MKREIHNTIIIGGGASGLFCGAVLGEKINDVLILEKNQRVGKKLSATGNGQGNLTNKNITPDNYHGDKLFAEYALNNFDNKKLIDYFEYLGGYFICDERGRYYPSSLQATSLTDLLRFKIENLKVKIQTETVVTDIIKSDVFEIRTVKGDIFYSENVIIACGGMAAKQFVIDGSAYKLAQKTGHKITQLMPSLVQLKTETEFIRGLKGIKADCKAYAYSANKLIKEDDGEVLFTDYGVSGNVIFQLSSYLVGADKPEIRLEFLPDITYEQLLLLLKNKVEKYDFPIEELFTGILNKQLGRAVLKYSGINNLTEKAVDCIISLEKIARAVKEFKIKVTGNLGFDYAQVTRGGVQTEEIDNKTMMSKLVKNLYFTGEIVNVDGDCGGYNLQWAFSSAYIAANSIIKVYAL